MSRRICGFAALVLASAVGRAAFAAPVVGSIDVQTAPLFRGMPFQISAQASRDAVRALALVDFRPWAATVLRVPLTRQGTVWRGTATTPLAVQADPGDLATVRVLAFDGRLQHGEAAIQVPVSPVSAVYDEDEGELDVLAGSGDDTIVVGRDASGAILINGGAIPVAFGPATVDDTFLVDVYSGDGDDDLSIDTSNGPLPLVSLYGDAGNDVLTGSDGNDNLYGDDGDDVLRAGPGSDFVVGGAGNDTFVWRAGDGSDALEGLDGDDTLVVEGTDAGERFDLSPDGSHARLRRDLDGALIDLSSVERVIVRARGGADMLTVDSLALTEVRAVVLDLAAVPGGAAPDGQPDDVLVRGTDRADWISLIGPAAEPTVIARGVRTTILGADPALDTLTIDPLGGNDTVNAAGLPPGGLRLVVIQH